MQNLYTSLGYLKGLCPLGFKFHFWESSSRNYLKDYFAHTCLYKQYLLRYLFHGLLCCHLKRCLGVPWWGPVDENPPSNAGDMRSNPSPGAKIPHALGQLNPCAIIREPSGSNEDLM